VETVPSQPVPNSTQAGVVPTSFPAQVLTPTANRNPTPAGPNVKRKGKKVKGRRGKEDEDSKFTTAKGHEVRTLHGRQRRGGRPVTVDEVEDEVEQGDEDEEQERVTIDNRFELLDVEQ